MIIDSTNQFVMERDSFEELFTPSKIIEVEKDVLYRKYDEAIDSGRINKEDGFYIPVAVALDKQLRLGGK